jgi:excisionase family DNA binding protein
VARSTTTHRRHLVSVGQAAEYAQVSDKTIRRRITDGTLTRHQLGKRIVRVDLDELDAVLRGERATGGSAA